MYEGGAKHGNVKIEEITGEGVFRWRGDMNPELE